MCAGHYVRRLRNVCWQISSAIEKERRWVYLRAEIIKINNNGEFMSGPSDRVCGREGVRRCYGDYIFFFGLVKEMGKGMFTEYPIACVIKIVQ